jgi:hypothetical protein
MIDLKRLFREHNIRFIEAGNNVAKGNINVHCVLCGSNDQSEHLGIRLSDGAWGCWRNKSHRGKNLVRLLQILGIPYVEEHKEILSKLVNRTLFEQEVEKIKEKDIPKYTELPMDFVSLTDQSVFNKMYLNYLRNRGFDDPKAVAEYYGLCRSLKAGKWSARIIIPCFVKDEVSWVGRTIGSNNLRYLTPSKDDPAKNIKDCIGNFNELKETEGESLVIVEGSLDQMKCDWYTKGRGIRATCLFGLSITESQIHLLEEICPNFNTILLGLDQGTLTQSLDLMKRLRKYNPVIMQLPKKDIGEMSKDEINSLLNRYLS